MQGLNIKSLLYSQIKAACGIRKLKEKNPHGPLIVTYHGVVEEETLAENEEYLIDRKTLQEHLRFFKKQYDMVPLSLLWDLLHSGETLNEKWLSIVLDDAYQNQVFLGASVLADYQVPWSLAVPAGLIGSSRGVWSNELAVLVERCWSKESLPLPGKANRSVSTRTLGERRIAARWVRNILFDQIFNPVKIRVRVIYFFKDPKVI